MHPALVIIDMVSAFDFPEAPALHPSVVAAAKQIRRLRAHFQKHGHPVIFANDNFANWRADFNQLVNMARASGGTGHAVVELLPPQPEDYFVLKPKHSAFLATALPVLLAKLGVDRVYLTGMTADSCVLATAVDANAREYDVRVVADAVAGLAPAKRRALALIDEGHIGEVVTTTAAMRQVR
ncbi:MAG TPA: cysteine hydrolase [Stenotrophomonas sp.]|nr:cysteine hydrolase [Stenotrophomonas sp.]